MVAHIEKEKKIFDMDKINFGISNRDRKKLKIRQQKYNN